MLGQHGKSQSPNEPIQWHTGVSQRVEGKNYGLQRLLLEARPFALHQSKNHSDPDAHQSVGGSGGERGEEVCFLLPPEPK